MKKRSIIMFILTIAIACNLSACKVILPKGSSDLRHLSYAVTALSKQTSMDYNVTFNVDSIYADNFMSYDVKQLVLDGVTVASITTMPNNSTWVAYVKSDTYFEYSDGSLKNSGSIDYFAPANRIDPVYYIIYNAAKLNSTVSVTNILSSNSKEYNLAIKQSSFSFFEDLIATENNEPLQSAEMKLVVDASSNIKSFICELDFLDCDVVYSIDFKNFGSTVIINLPSNIGDGFIGEDHVPNPPFPEYPEYPEEPNPPFPDLDDDNNVYEDSADGATVHHTFGGNKPVFVPSLNAIAMIDSPSISLYDVDSMQLIATKKMVKRICSIAEDQGKLAVGLTNNDDQHEIQIYNAHDLMLELTFPPLIVPSSIVLDGKVVTYSNHDQWCSVVQYNTTSNTEKILLDMIFSPGLTFNKAEHLIYITEIGLSSTRLFYVNSLSGEVVSSFTNFSVFGYTLQPFYFDGQYPHLFNKVFSATQLEIVAEGNLVRKYQPFRNFTPQYTKYIDNEYSLVQGVYTQNGQSSYVAIGFYNLQKEKYEYMVRFKADAVHKLDDKKFLLINNNKYRTCIIDLNKVSSFTDDNYTESPLFDEIIKGNNNILNNLAQPYTDVKYDDGKMYLLNSDLKTLRVYDSTSLTLLKELSFLINPAGLDAYKGKLVVGFGDSRLFCYYDGFEAPPKIIYVAAHVDSILLHNQSVYFASNSGSILSYDLMSGNLSHLLSYYDAALAINRQENILYIGERRLSSSDLAFYDLNSHNILYQSEFGQHVYNDTLVSFDEKHVHYDGKLFDAISGSLISNSESEPYPYLTAENVKTLYNDGHKAILSAFQNNQYRTLIYDLKNSGVIYSFDFAASFASLNNNKLVLSNANQILAYDLYFQN